MKNTKGPAHGILAHVLIASVGSEDSGEHVHLRSLTRVLAARIYNDETEIKDNTEY